MSIANETSKKLLLEYIDDIIDIERMPPILMGHQVLIDLISNRNRVAKFLGLPTRRFDTTLSKSKNRATRLLGLPDKP